MKNPRRLCSAGPGLLIFLLTVPGAGWGQPQPQPTMHLTLAEAQKLAIQNNPNFTAARLTAAAAYQVPTELHSAFEPAFFGSLTGVGADSGSRLAAGGLNNPVVYDRFGSGLPCLCPVGAASRKPWLRQ